MMEIRKKSRARVCHQPTQSPCKNPSPELRDRDEWICETCTGFVSPSKANKVYYRIILETLWPVGHGIPGPLVSEKEIRKAIDAYRGSPYRDSFRRMRELQGEEGLLGIVKSGNKYQLISLEISEKRHPRGHLNDLEWERIRRRYGGVCAVCGRPPETTGFQQDHKIPRLRGGSDETINWQPLCDECNNFKSTACRNCRQDCRACCWAFPEKYKPIIMDAPTIQRIRDYAEKKGDSPEGVLRRLVHEHISEETDKNQV